MSGIYSITPFTQLDFPNHLACIIWFSGCNMRCVYCYNPEIVLGQSKLTEEDTFKFLSSRESLLEGVVLSGGEATTYSNLIPFCREVKKRGYKIKLDTNGSRPDVITKLLDENLLSYVALDIKATPRKFKFITQSKLKFEAISQSLLLLCKQKNVPFEARTTVHTEYLDDLDLHEIQDYLLCAGYRGTHFLQRFRYQPNTIGKVDPATKSISEELCLSLPLNTELR